MGPKNRAFVVVNPVSGGGRGRRDWPKVQAELKKRIGTFEFEETTAIGHARTIATDAAQAGFSPVIACGGDGTIHEVVNGIWDAAVRPALGIISVGTGGDLIKTLQIPRKLTDQVRIVAGKRKRTIDLGRIEYTNREEKKERRVFVNIADAGLGAEVVRQLHRSRALFGRRLAYISSTLQSYLAWEPKRIRIVTDHPDEMTGKTLAVVVANGRYFGGGMPIAPRADPADGYFDLVVVGELNPVKVLLAIPLLYAGQLHRLDGVRSDRVRKVTLASEEPVRLDIDGEPIGSLPATFEILPGALEVLAS